MGGQPVELVRNFLADSSDQADLLVFKVPHTEDMASTLFDPRKPKSVWDLLILGLIALYIALYFLTTGWFRKGLFLSFFIFWRLSYNGGIGYVLYMQSNYNMLVRSAISYKLFDKSNDTWKYQFIKQQLSSKMGSDYDYESAPLEYQTWLLFRRGVDLILMMDFASYLLLAVSWAYVPETHGLLKHSLRWIAGWALILFNLWVKLDANRVVKVCPYIDLTGGLQTEAV